MSEASNPSSSVSALTPSPSEGADALKLHADDHVATLLRDLSAGELCSIGTPDGTILSLQLVESIPMHHKVALVALSREQPVLKYGEVIGQARRDIAPGSHVHTHNLVSLRAGAR